MSQHDGTEEFARFEILQSIAGLLGYGLARATRMSGGVPVGSDYVLTDAEEGRTLTFAALDDLEQEITDVLSEQLNTMGVLTASRFLTVFDEGVLARDEFLAVAGADADAWLVKAEHQVLETSLPAASTGRGTRRL